MERQQAAPLAEYRTEFGVPDEAIDENGHVNNVRYVQWMQDLAVAHWEGVGGKGINARQGCTWVARRHQIEYLRPAYAGDRIEAVTWVADIGRVRSRRCYAFRRLDDGELLARGETQWVFVDAESGRPRMIPESVQEVLPVSEKGSQNR
jgi:acyl-CoA thioester hydrolase